MAAEPLIAVFTKNDTNPAYAAARLGADRAAARLGARSRHFVPSFPDDPVQQSALVDEALRLRPAAFVFNPAHENAVDDAIERIDASGIPLVNIINRMRRGRRIAFVGSDDRALAEAVARRLARELGGRGAIAIMEGTAGSVTNQARMVGFAAALTDHPSLAVVARGTAAYQREPAGALMRAWLARGLRLDGLLCANDVMALGALDVLDEVGLRLAVCGVNALPEAIVAIERGAMLATADFDAMKMACVGTEAAIRHLRGEAIPAEIMLPVEVIDAANCARWDRPIEARECPRWEDVVPPTSSVRASPAPR